MSRTQNRTPPSAGSAPTVIVPPAGVNFRVLYQLRHLLRPAYQAKPTSFDPTDLEEIPDQALHLCRRLPDERHLLPRRVDLSKVEEPVQDAGRHPDLR